MASTSRLDDIAAASDQLSGLGDRQRGEPIEAGQWNTLVDVLRKILEIDRGQETGVSQALADSFARSTHDHLGAVTLSWLDSDLQQRALGGDGGSISVRSVLADVTARVAAVVDQVAALSQQVETAQRRSDDRSVDELARSAKLRDFENRFSGVEGLQGLVGSLSADMIGIQPQLQTVLDLRSTLTTDAGQPIDVRALSRQVDAIDAAQKDAVLGVDGTPLRLRDVQVSLSEINDVLGIGAGGGLDGRLATLAAQLQGQLDTRLDDRLGTLQGQVAAQLQQVADSVPGQVGAQVQPAVDAALDTVRADLGAQLTAQAADLSQQTDTKLGALAGATDEKLAAASVATEDKLAALDGSVDARLNAASDVITQRVLEQSSDQITGNVLAQVRSQLPDMVAGAVKGQLAEIQKMLANLDARVRKLEQKILG